MNSCFCDRHIKMTAELLEVLRRYEPFKGAFHLSFTAGEGLDYPFINMRLTSPDGVPFSEAPAGSDSAKLSTLHDQTCIIRPFFTPRCRTEWSEAEANAFASPDFDYGAVLGYTVESDGSTPLKTLFLVPTDLLLAGQSPDEDGIWRVHGLASHMVYQLSLDPRKKFSRSLYLGTRISEELLVHIEEVGPFYSSR